MGVDKQKGFRVEYCHVNDEYVAVIKDTVFMGAGKTIQEAIDELQADVDRGDQDTDQAPATPSAKDLDFSKLDHFSFGGDEQEEGEEDELSEDAPAEDVEETP